FFLLLHPSSLLFISNRQPKQTAPSKTACCTSCHLSLRLALRARKCLGLRPKRREDVYKSPSSSRQLIYRLRTRDSRPRSARPRTCRLASIQSRPRLASLSLNPFRRQRASRASRQASD